MNTTIVTAVGILPEMVRVASSGRRHYNDHAWIGD